MVGYLTVKEAAASAGLSVAAIYQAIASGRLRARKAGKAWEISPAWLARFNRSRLGLAANDFDHIQAAEQALQAAIADMRVHRDLAAGKVAGYVWDKAKEYRHGQCVAALAALQSIPEEPGAG